MTTSPAYRPRHAAPGPGPGGAGLWVGGDETGDRELLPAGRYQENEVGQQILAPGPGGSSVLAEQFPDKAHSGELPGDSD